MKKRQWIKYTPVVLAFVIMAGLFWPGMKTQVNATETEEQTADWSIKVQYNWGEKTEEIEISPVSGMYSFNLKESVNRDGYSFKGWIKNSDTSIVYEGGDYMQIEGKDTNKDTVIVFTAQWEWDGKTIVPNESLALEAEVPYVLSAGTWNVSGDEYSYTSSENGLTFYVGSNGNYTFTKN